MWNSAFGGLSSAEDADFSLNRKPLGMLVVPAPRDHIHILIDRGADVKLIRRAEEDVLRFYQRAVAFNGIRRRYGVYKDFVAQERSRPVVEPNEQTRGDRGLLQLDLDPIYSLTVCRSGRQLR